MLSIIPRVPRQKFDVKHWLIRVKENRCGEKLERRGGNDRSEGLNLESLLTKEKEVKVDKDRREEIPRILVVVDDVDYELGQCRSVEEINYNQRGTLVFFI
jgi:hypothetical protein